MKIHRMRATFGKLEHETLTLEPGLNVIQAPNEWGKSTWCAFLCAMLYGLDTRAKSTRGTLADKERYAPWSGSPMEGRLEVEWQGRDITIERRTRGRVPLGEFRAYETASGVSVPELTAANCGEMLTGAEQSVFRRAGFLRLSDLPVTQDEALRRRLRSLVTTGDESGEAQRLEQSLRELRNRCRYNRSGLLPQAEQQRQELEEKITDLENLSGQRERAKAQLAQLETERKALENHRLALAFAEARRVEALRRETQAALELAAARRETLQRLAPDGQTARRNLEQLQALREEWRVLRLERESLPPGDSLPPAFRGQFPGAGLEQDIARYEKRKIIPLPASLAAVTAWAAAAALLLWGRWLWGGIALGLGAAALALAAASLVSCRKMERSYGSRSPEQWRRTLDTSLRARRLEERGSLLRQRGEALWGETGPEEAERQWQRELELSADLEEALREEAQCRAQLEALGEAREEAAPEQEDSLLLTREETDAALEDVLREQRRLQNLLGQYQGKMESLGSNGQLQTELERVKGRIRSLEDTYAALNVALDTLTRAKQELQRRFAPRITRRAGELLTALTGGRYEKLTWGEDFSLTAGAAGEDTQRSVLWRSDGTADQLYLALRLAVSEELMGDAPLILDDALVRFDDARLSSALRLLRQQSEHRQVILFSCQSREKEILARMRKD